ncbi:MAG: DUF4142 domain-containing protein [Candidatus Eremiobacteraeota bacterium]|nr:DUF4142 domain-containing protein [Candidatus Eremiobacteraeota bacterium]
MNLSSLTLACALCTAAPALSAVSPDDQSFVQTAQQDVLGNYALAALARSKAQNPRAKALAAEIASNAAAANDFIRTYAKEHDVALENKPSARAGNQYGNISSDDAKSFDGDFAKAIYIDANMAVDDFKDEAAHGSDPALRDFAKKQLQALEQIAGTAQKLGPQ